MFSRACAFSLLLVLSFLLLGCNNTLDPLCGSARPLPLIGSLSPSTVTFAEVEDGITLVVNGSQFVASSMVTINGTPLSTTVVSDQQLKVKLSNDVISAPGSVKVAVQTPGGNSGNLGCTSGGESSALTLTVN